jgi:exodeoxyribonuclease-3
VVALGQKSYNGVAILSKYDFEVTNRNLPDFTEDNAARYLEILVNNNGKKFYIASVYAPNGCSVDKNVEQEKLSYKLKWFNKLYSRMNSIIKSGLPVIIGGDFNVMMENIDVFDEDKFKNSPLYLKDVRDKITSLSYLGLYDCFRLLYKNKEGYTFWDYAGNSFVTNLGLRIDYVLASSYFADKLIDIHVDKTLRQVERPSDHTVLIAEFRD